MYVINKTKGIGEIISETETKVTIYFDEVDEERTLLKAFTTVYSTIEEAESAMNPEVDYDKVLESIEEEKSEIIERKKAIRRGEELLEASTIELKKYI